MAKPKRIIPEFMLDNPDDTFIFLMPISLKPDDEDIGNSYFKVAVKNLTTKEHFTTLMSPEIFFTHFKLHKAYKNAKLDKQANKYIKTNKRIYNIDTRLSVAQYNTNLGDCLDKDFIGQLLGYKHTYMHEAQKVSCCIIKTKTTDIIIPHYAIAIYYYYRSTVLREAILKSNLEELYLGVICNPHDASIVIPRYVPEEDAAFIHRFLCQEDAIDSFNKIGTYINAYIRNEKDKNIKRRKNNEPLEPIDSVPIKAKFPVEGMFSITSTVSDFYHKGRYYKYVHEILDDDSDIGFTKFTTFIQSNKIVTEVDDIDKLPTIPREVPSETSERLKSNHANRKYKYNTVTSNRKKKCSSLSGVDISNEKITDEETLQKLKIIEETTTNEVVDQSLTDASGNGEKKTRKTKVSSKGSETIKVSTTEYTHNFDEFNQYVEYMRTQKAIEEFFVYDVQKMKVVMNGENENPNKKCIMHGRERQYITATFKYKNRYAGLLELENTALTSTWVIVSKNIIDDNVFDRFLNYYVDDDMAINEIKAIYKYNTTIRLKTKNHERDLELTDEDKIRWLAGLLEKISLN